MTRQCVVCDSTENLNTEMTIKLDDGTRVPVDICDTHEDTTPKEAKAAYLQRQSKISALLEQLKALGANVNIGPAVQTASGLILPMPTATPQPQQPQQMPTRQALIEEATLEDGSELTIVDASVVDSKITRSIGGGLAEATQHVGYDRLASGDKLPVEALQGKVALTVVEGRSGLPIQIPAKRVDGLGTTTIRIKKSSDAQLQQRFKTESARSVHPESEGIKTEYEEDVVCPVCYGNCQVKNAGVMIACPKCGGNGVITR